MKRFFGRYGVFFLVFILSSATYFFIFTENKEVPKLASPRESNVIHETVFWKAPSFYSIPADMMDHSKFRYLISQGRLCNETFSPPSVVICVFSEPRNVENRMLIRDTWGNRNIILRLNARIVFFIGKTADIFGKNSIYWENRLYGDIVQESFIDSYQNLSYKGIATLRWIGRFCSSAKYMVKIDDDVLVNVYNLRKFINGNVESMQTLPASFFCQPAIWIIVPNKNQSRFIRSNVTSHQKHRLKYCSGKAFILPLPALSKLYNASFFSPFNIVANVYITGLLARTANFSHVNLENYYSTNPDLLVTGDAIFSELDVENDMISRTNIGEKILKMEIALSKIL